MWPRKTCAATRLKASLSHNPIMEILDADSIVDASPGPVSAEWRFMAGGVEALISPIPEELARDHAPATHTMLEWTDYGVSFPGAAAVNVGGIQLQRFAGDWFLLKFENQIGLAELRAFDEDGRSIASSRWVLVLSKK